MADTKAKPFLKWAGGKTQLISAIEKALPQRIREQKFVYAEPFVGSGAMLFWMLNHFPNLERAVINDINADLVNTYQIIASKPKELISILEILQNEFHNLDENEEEKKIYYYHKRELYNSKKEGKTGHAALFIFLNRTCFNGLYRVNRKNNFNVPMGSYKKPCICDMQNILAVSKGLQKVTILEGDFEQTLNYADKNSLFYLDPPYKPLNRTSNFNSYAQGEFGDKEQIRLKNFCSLLDYKGHTWILSNSDLKANNMNNNFFDDLYSDFAISRVDARRNINSVAEKRGTLKELLITNQNCKD